MPKSSILGVLILKSDNLRIFRMVKNFHHEGIELIVTYQTQSIWIKNMTNSMEV